MRRHRRGGLLVTLGLAAGGLLVATNPGVPALASGQVCAGIVIDDGTGAAPLTQGASVPPGSSDLDLLEAAGDSFKQVDSGLVCVINGYPVNGVQNCLEADHGLFYYWSYWEGDATTNTWTYANVGPAEHTVDAGQSYVEGWRYQDPGPDSPAAAKPSETPAAAFAQACQGAPPTTTTTTTATPGGRHGGRHPGATSGVPSPRRPRRPSGNRPRETESHLGRPGCAHVHHDHDADSQRTGCRRCPHRHDFDVHQPEPAETDVVVRARPRPFRWAWSFRGRLGAADHHRGGHRRNVGRDGMALVAAKAGRRVTRAAAPRRRSLHPVAWWLWAAGLAVCAMRTNNPFLLALIGAVACFVVSVCRSSAPWSRSIGFFLRLGVIVIVIRVVIEILFGQRGVPGHVLFNLPQVPLPSWAVAVSIGGAVTLESILDAFVEGLQIAVILLCFGAANSLASPYRLLRCLPAVLYETGVAVTVALAFTPELVQSIGIVRQARRQRGIPTRGLRGMRGVAVPVLESALDRSLQLATSMDARGYGRRVSVGNASRRLASLTTTAGLLLVAVGLYGVIDSGSLFGLGLPIMAVAALLCGIGLAVGGRRTARSRYRPDPWRRPEWLVAASGLAALLAMSIAHALDVPGLTVSFTPLAFPSIPVLAVVGILIALAPVVAAPGTISRSTRHTGGGPAGDRPQTTDSQAGRPIPADLSRTSA